MLLCVTNRQVDWGVSSQNSKVVQPWQTHLTECTENCCVSLKLCRMHYVLQDWHSTLQDTDSRMCNLAAGIKARVPFKKLYQCGQYT